MQTRFGGSNELECLNCFNEDQVCDFQMILTQSFDCLETRLRCPSTSMDMKVSQNSIVSYRQLHEQVPLYLPTCTVLTVIQFTTFPNTVIHFNSFPTIFPDEMRPEAQQMAGELLKCKSQINNVNRERRRLISEDVGFDVELLISLDDVFSVLESRRYPLLWRGLIKANTIIKTTVICEQSFSVSKHSTHLNMKPATFITNATNKCYE